MTLVQMLLPRRINILVPLILSIVCASASADGLIKENDPRYPLAPNPPRGELPEFVVAEYSGMRFEPLSIANSSHFKSEHMWVRKPSSQSEMKTKKVDWGLFRNPDRWASSPEVLACLVWKEGALIYERYNHDRTEHHRLRGFSMTKTLTALLMGIPVSEGKIALDNPTHDYIPELKGYWLGEVTIRNHLKMAHGSDWSYDKKNAGDYWMRKYDIANCTHKGPCGQDLFSVWKTYQKKDEQGSVFNYSPISSDILSLVISRAYGKNSSKVFEERIWAKIGAQRDAVWRSSRINLSITSGADEFHATGRDWIRLGELLASLGSFRGTQVVDKTYVESMRNDVVKIGNQPTAEYRVANYGYQVAINTDGKTFILRGWRGQTLYVSPETQTVMLVSTIDPIAKQGHDFWLWLKDIPLEKLGGGG